MKPKVGTVKYSMYRVKYKLTPSLRGGRLGLQMRYGNRSWRYMDSVLAGISGSALRDYARDYLIIEKMIKPRY